MKPIHRICKTLTLLAAALSFAVSSTAALANSPEKRSVSIAVGGKSSFYYLPLTIAERLGYFRDEGLEVEVADFAGGSKALQAVVGGSADVVSGAFEHIINMQSKGQPFKTFVLQGRSPDVAIGIVPTGSTNMVAKELGILNHVGQTEYEAGFGGGERMAAAGATKALCVNQEVGNVALDLRCQGFADAMAESGGTVDVVAVDLADPVDSQQRIGAAVTANPDVDSILALGPTGAAPTLAAMEEMGREDILLATFDLSPEVLDAVESGRMLFAIDQQQYLQGYLPIVMLTLYNTNLNTVANDVIMTGPGFVTADNAAQVKDLSAAGTR